MSSQEEADWLHAQHFGTGKRGSRLSVWLFTRHPGAIMTLGLLLMAAVVWAPVIAGALVALVLLAVAVRLMLTAGD